MKRKLESKNMVTNTFTEALRQPTAEEAAIITKASAGLSVSGEPMIIDISNNDEIYFGV